MRCRPCASKPTLALWMVIAVTDLAVFVSGAGLLVLLSIVAALVAVAGAVAAAFLHARRAKATRLTRTGRRVGGTPQGIA